MYDGTVRTLCDVRHILELKKILISLDTLHKNDFIPKADEDRETIRIVKGALTVMKGKITTGNIYKLLGSTVVGGVHSVESHDDNTKLWHMRLGLTLEYLTISPSSESPSSTLIFSLERKHSQTRVHYS